MSPNQKNKVLRKSASSFLVSKIAGLSKKPSGVQPVFKPGSLYRVKADIPVYLFRGDYMENMTLEEYNKTMGWTSSRPGVPPMQPKVTIPGEEVVMCLAVESFPDRRRTRITEEEEEVGTRVSENSVITLIDYSVNKKTGVLAKHHHQQDTSNNTQQQEDLCEENLVYEVMLLWQERRHIVVCMGMSSLRLVKSLFFTDLEI
jgi:hypothetical protein